jgi:hypothetical protein
MSNSVLSGDFLIRFINNDQFDTFIKNKEMFMTAFAVHGTGSILSSLRQSLEVYCSYSTIQFQQRLSGIIWICLKQSLHQMASTSKANLDKILVTLTTSIPFTLTASNLTKETTLYLIFTSKGNDDTVIPLNWKIINLSPQPIHNYYPFVYNDQLALWTPPFNKGGGNVIAGAWVFVERGDYWAVNVVDDSYQFTKNGRNLSILYNICSCSRWRFRWVSACSKYIQSVSHHWMWLCIK